MLRHPWVFSGALDSIPDGIPPGEPVRLTDPDGNYLASGYFSSYAQIAVRLWGFDPGEEVDRTFFARRIRRALELRRSFVERPGTDAYRLVHGENDLLPGLIVDRYADYLVLQCHTRGIERWKQEIVEALVEVLAPRGIYERSDVSVRMRDGVELPTGTLRGEVPDVIEIRENGYRFLVDVKRGQKTGFFLDQRDKRMATMKYAEGRTVLNAFSYTGGFSVYALAGGARHVVSLDSSGPALELARENVRINGFGPDRAEFVEEDVKKYLRTAAPGAFGLVVLDPPAFIKDRRKKEQGIVGYRTVNEGALRALAADGVLVTCSCSAHLAVAEFRHMVAECGGRARRSFAVLETLLHGPDHPSLAAFPEGDYLKCLICR
jgi:23S rRNA (cytosine1962-C5)-methyltransferase